MEQTAVEWLIEQIKKGEVSYGMFQVPNHTEIFEQAKEMEQEQLMEKYDEGLNDGMNVFR